MLDLIHRTNWDNLYFYFAKGNPPIIFQLLALNTIFFMVFAIRRMRGAPNLRASTASNIQSMLLAANIVIVLRESIFNSVSWVF
jgi:hypothetical protein